MLFRSKAQPGQTVVPFETDAVKAPKALEVMELSPQSMALTIDRLSRKSVPVEAVWKGRIGDDYRLVDSTCVPAEVALRGPAQVLDRLEKVQTLAVSVNSTRPGVVGADTALALPAEVRADPAKVKVVLNFGLKTKDVWLRLPVDVTAPAGVTATVRPATVQVYVEVPVTMLREPDFRDRFGAVVALEPHPAPGRRTMAYRLKLPPDATLHKAVPDEAEVAVDTEKKQGN